MDSATPFARRLEIGDFDATNGSVSHGGFICKSRSTSKDTDISVHDWTGLSENETKITRYLEMNRLRSGIPGLCTVTKEQIDGCVCTQGHKVTLVFDEDFSDAEFGNLHYNVSCMSKDSARILAANCNPLRPFTPMPATL